MQNTNQHTGFFDRIRSWGLYRGDGWIGGVSVALAARLNIDVVLVRGIFVAGTIIGLPFIPLYLLGWLFLPDLKGSIPIENLFRGSTIGPVVVLTVIVLAALGGLSVVVFFIFGLAATTLYGFGGLSFFGFLILATVAVFVVWLIRKIFSSPQDSTAPHQNFDSGVAAAAENAQRLDDQEQHISGFEGDFLADVSQQRVQQLSDQQRLRREQAEIVRQARQRKYQEYLQLNPKLSAAWVLITVGAAALTVSFIFLSTKNTVMMLFSAVSVFSIAMILSGIAKRRSPGLVWLTILSVGVALFSLPVTFIDSVHHKENIVVNFSGQEQFMGVLGEQIDFRDFEEKDSGLGGTLTLRQLITSTDVLLPKDRDLTVQLTIINPKGGLYLWDGETGDDVTEDSEYITVLSQNSDMATYRLGPDTGIDFYLEIENLTSDIWVGWFDGANCIQSDYDQEAGTCQK